MSNTEKVNGRLCSVKEIHSLFYYSTISCFIRLYLHQKDKTIVPDYIIVTDEHTANDKADY